jgi:flagellar motor switch protein FliG
MIQGMKIARLSFLIGAFLLCKNVSFLHAEAEAPDPIVLEQERRLKDDTERQAQGICDSILGKGKSSVLVNVELGLESSRKGGSALNQKRDNKSGLGDDNFLLPWVPAPKSVTKEETPKDASVETQAAQQASMDVKTVLRRFDITVVHDEKIPKERIVAAQETLTSTFDRYKAVLKLFFRATSFVSEHSSDGEVVKKNIIESLNLKTILLLFLLMLLFMLIRFFLGPLADFLKNYIDGMKEQSKSKVEMENKSENENDSESETENEDEGNLDGAGGELTPEEQALLEAQEEAMKKFEPFTYVTDENLKQLAYLLHHEEPWIVALVISYLTAERALKVMEALPADLQAKVALETAMYRQTSLEQVQAINEDIKQKIDFVVGGLDKLVAILESSDRFARENILEYLKNQKPAIFERIREHILLWEDFANFPKQAMQVIVRELKNEQLAQALRGASPELQQKFFENMSQGAVTLLKEEMEYGRPVTEDQIEEERRKIIDLVKAMEKDGKVSFRQRGKVQTLDGDEMGVGLAAHRMSAAHNDPVQAYNAGVAAMEQGNIEEAVTEFEVCVQLNPQSVEGYQGLANALYGAGRYPEALAAYDMLLSLQPNPELQSWVEQLRASLSAAA